MSQNGLFVVIDLPPQAAPAFIARTLRPSSNKMAILLVSSTSMTMPLPNFGCCIGSPAPKTSRIEYERMAASLRMASSSMRRCHSRALNGAAAAVPGIRRAVARSTAQVVYVANLAAQEPESEGYDVSDHVAALAVHGLTPDAVLYDPDRLAGVDGVSTAVGEQLTEANPWVHDAERLAEALAGLAGVPLWSEREQAAND